MIWQGSLTEDGPLDRRQLAVLICQATIGLSSLFALLGNPADAMGQVVQLPTFRTFGVGTTVLVPDSGQGALGGIRRGRSGTIGRSTPFLGSAPGFANRARGSSRSASLVTAQATIIDLAELDKLVRSEAERLRAEALSEHAKRLGAEGKELLNGDERAKARFLNRHMGRRNR